MSIPSPSAWGAGKPRLAAAAVAALLIVLTLALRSSKIPTVRIPATTWSMYQARADHNAVLESPPWRVRWTFATRSRLNGGLALIGTILYLNGTDGNAYALDARTGELRWKRAVGGVTMTAPIVADGLVFVGTGTGEVRVDTPRRVVWGRPQGDAIVALDAQNGWPVWRFPTVGENMPTAAYVHVRDHDELVFTGGDDHVYALDPRTGKLLWKRPTFGVATMSSLATSGDLVVGLFNLSQHYGDENARDEARYRLRSWTWALDAARRRFVWMTPFGNSDCSPTIGAGSVFVEAERRLDPAGSPWGRATNTVAALDLQSGTIRWTYTSAPGSYSDAGTNEEAIAGLYVSGTYFDALPYPRRFAAFDAASGRLRWSIGTTAPVKMSAVEANGKLYFGDTGGTLYVVAARDGSILTRRSFPKGFDAAPPLVAGRTLYLANGNRVLAIPLDSLTRAAPAR